MKTFSALALFSYFVGALAVAVVERTTYPEVIPGPGLPSLESLGITSEWLYTRPPPVAKNLNSTLEKRYYGVCSLSPAAATADALACYNYLWSLGTVSCLIEGSTTTFCTSGTATVTGDNVSGASSASSYCSDVALAVEWAYDYCTNTDDSTTAGSGAANGNGGLIVYTQ